MPIFFGCNRFILSGNTFYLIDIFSLKRSIILKQRRNVENQIYLSLIKGWVFFALIILTLYPHRQPYRGVSDWVRQTSTEYLTHTCTHTHTHIHTHIRNNTLQTDIYAQKQKYNIRTQSAHNFHTIRTQFAHTQHRERQYAAQDNTEHNTYDLHKHSFDFIV